MQGGSFGSKKAQIIPEESMFKELSSETATEIVGSLNSIKDGTNSAYESMDEYLTYLSKNGKGYITDYVKTNQNQVYITEDVIQASKNARAAQIAQNEAIKQSTISAKAGQVALKGLAMAGNMLAMWAISEVITLAVTGLDHLINKEKYEAKALEEMSQKADDAKSKIKSIQSEIKSNADTVDEAGKKYAELAQGVNQLTGKNISLSDDEYKEFLDVSNQLAEVFPQLTKGYDDNGNAILDLQGNVDGITGKLQSLLEVEQQLAQQEIDKNLDTYFENEPAVLKKTEQSYQQTKETLDSYKQGYADLLSLIKSGKNVEIEQGTMGYQSYKDMMAFLQKSGVSNKLCRKYFSIGIIISLIYNIVTYFYLHMNIPMLRI